MEFYSQSARILEQLALRQGSIKSLVLGDDRVKDKKRTYALVCESLKYKAVIIQIIHKSGVLQADKRIRLSESLAVVLIHDLLFHRSGEKTLAKLGNPGRLILSQKSRIKAELARAKARAGVTTNEGLLPAAIRVDAGLPRYVRVNALKSTTDAVIEIFSKAGHSLVTTKPTGKQIARDLHLPELLLLPSGVDLHEHPLYLDGSIILQDKASCFPAYVLNPPKGAHAIDACAAPGNKTSHMSAILGNTGHIWAFDLDGRRLATLKKMTATAGCTNIDARHGSFLDVDPHSPEFAKVEYFILDPSCSGSGIVSRLDHLANLAVAAEEHEQLDDQSAKDEDQRQRLLALAEFQLSVIQHAFKFPGAKKIVYSTCSVHEEENERVVLSALNTWPSGHRKFELAPRSAVIPTWPRRGNPIDGLTNDEADAAIRCMPEDDLNGFFVACFVRKEHATATALLASSESGILKNTAKNQKKRLQKKRKRAQETNDCESIKPGL